MGNNITLIYAWEQRRLGELIEISSASRVHKDEWTNEGVPFFRSSDVTSIFKGTQNTKAYISHGLYESLSAKSGRAKKHDVLATGGGSIAIPYLVPNDEPLYFKDADLIWMKTNEKVRGQFLYNFFTSPNLRNYVQTISHVGTISHYTIEQAKDTPISLPTANEQEKIGQFFRTLDNTIAIYKRKLDGLRELKKAFLQQMFPQSGEIVPRIRFEGFSEPWKVCKLGDVIERVQGNDGRMDLPTLTISAGNGWLDQRERFSNNIAGKEQEHYTLLRKGELSYNKGNSKLAKYGVVFELKTHDEALVPRVYHSFRSTDKSSATFLEYMFATKILDSELAKLITSGARMDGLLNIGFEAFAGITISIPKRSEQDKISVFLRTLDRQIENQSKKLEQYKVLKSAYLQKMLI